MNKEELRALYKQIRLRMPPSEISIKSRMINKKLINDLDWQNYPRICAFEPIAKFNEVDIKPLTNRLKTHTKLEIHVLKSDKMESPPKTQFDLILIPCLAFDSANYRLGWGGGWYDKFLASQPEALKIGVCYQNGFIEQGIPFEDHDISLDSIITEI